jgi:hypothetical protein
MAKKEAPKSDGKFVPSMCGSHAEMEAKDDNIQLKPELAKKMILLKDDRGLYVTDRWRLISPSNCMADCNRLAPDKDRQQKLMDCTEPVWKELPPIQDAVAAKPAEPTAPESKVEASDIPVVV